MDDITALSENEKQALEYLARRRAVLVTQIGDRNERDLFGSITPGRGVFNKLIKKGLAYETDEPILDDGFQFTPMLEITEEGERVAELVAKANAAPVKKAAVKKASPAR